jgi:hypothetical protein
MSNSPFLSNNGPKAEMESERAFAELRLSNEHRPFDIPFGGSLWRFRSLDPLPETTTCPPAPLGHTSPSRNASDPSHPPSHGAGPAHNPGRYLDINSGIRFHSRSEAACAALMELFIPGYRTIEGVTYEVPVGTDAYGQTLRVDFRHDDTLIEFHPVRLWRSHRRYGEFPSPKEWREFNRQYHNCPREELSELIRKTLHDLTQHYYRKKLGVIRANPELAHTELVVATNATEFYEKVICRFSPEPPLIGDFCELFNATAADVKDLCLPRGKRH